MTDHTRTYFDAAADLCRAVSAERFTALVEQLLRVREGGGRLFILGVGGGAAHASHAVNDFRKIAHIESYAPTDNVAELTARTNDEGWDTSYVEWLRTSRLNGKDAVLVFSVGGGSAEHGVSVNLVRALELAREVGAPILGVVGSPDGATAKWGDAVVVIDAPPALKTPLVEAMQAVVWHGLVSDPRLAAQAGKWEAVEGTA